MRFSANPSPALSSALALLLLASTTTSASLTRRQVCAAGYSTCAPTGAVSTMVPPVGPELAPLYTNLLASVKGIAGFVRRHDGDDGDDGDDEEDCNEDHDREDDDDDDDEEGDDEEHHHGEEDKKAHRCWLKKRDAVSMCCLTNTACLNLQTLNIPFCYDRFTTNFFLPTGAYGTLASGNYADPASGGTANLLNGTFAHAIAAAGTTPSGTTTGLVYGPSPPPNPATLAIPSPYTSAGVGSALAASALGVRATYTTTLPGTTVLPTVIAAITLTGSAGVSTVPASTVPGTTISPLTTVVTSTAGMAVAAATSATDATATTTASTATDTATTTATTTSTGGVGVSRSLPTGAVGMGAALGLVIVGMVGL